MYLSTKGEYGLLALLDLALHEGELQVQAAQIAARQQIPKQYLDQLLVLLKRAGLVESSRGRQGGYRLARPSDRISLYDGLVALEGPITNNNFGGAGRTQSARRTMRNVWDVVLERSTGPLRTTTLHDVARQCRSAEQALSYEI